jgi:predicted alpha/beta-fold hydrolase
MTLHKLRWISLFWIGFQTWIFRQTSVEAFSVVVAGRSADLPPSLYVSQKKADIAKEPSHIHTLAWFLTKKLVCSLQQDELECNETDLLTSRKVEQMTRWLNTRLLFGCTALEYAQAAAAMASTDGRILEYDYNQTELPTMLAMEDDDEHRDWEVSFQKPEISSELDVDIPIEEPARNLSFDVETKNEEAEISAGDTGDLFQGFGRPLEIIQSNVNRMQMPVKNLSEPTTNETLGSGNNTRYTSSEILSSEEQEEGVMDEISKQVDVLEKDPEMGHNLETEATHASVEASLEQGEAAQVVSQAKANDCPVEEEVEENELPSATRIPEDIENPKAESGSNRPRVQEIEPRHNDDQELMQISDSEDRRIRQISAAISHSFQAREFKPPFFARNGHVQTILSFVARNKNPALTGFQWDERKRMTTPDGDFFHVDWKFSDSDASIGRPSRDVPLVLLCHGLQSSSNSPLAKDMARAFNNVGMDVAGINFRGCSGEINNGPFGYHLSFTDDLKLMVEHIAATRPGTNIYLSGFSLGANVVTMLLAEMGTQALLKHNICGAAVNALPFDFIKVGPNFSKGLTKLLYGNDLLQSLQERILENYDDQDYSFTKEELLNCQTLREFDDLAVCAVYDFDGYQDYHRKSSTINILEQVAVPQLVVQALDDPFFRDNTNPQNNASQPLRIHYTEHGGHCGFVSVADVDDTKDAGWMPSEIARFLKHVNDQRSIQRDVYQLAGLNAGDDQELPSKIEDASIEQLKATKRRNATKISHSFQTRDFIPASYSRNPHVQTVMGALYRKETMYASPDLPTFLAQLSKTKDEFDWDKRQRMETPDGDFFDVDWRVSDMNFDSKEVPLVLICHGLQANSDSPLVKDMAEAFLNTGMGVACINFRGCSGQVNRTPRSYHLGFTEDLEQIIAFVNSRYPGKRIYLSGFSLGSNVVTKFLADCGDKAHGYNIGGAAVNALPFEVTKSTGNLNQAGLTKSLYADRILDSMYERIEEMFDNGVDFPFPREKIRQCKTILDMENLVIAPFFGFDDAWDYYDKTSTLNILDKVSVPELIIQSKDDPFLLGQSNLISKPEWPLRLQYTEYGGHCGHVFHSTESGYATSWMPTELARFLAHVELSLSSETKEGATKVELSPVFKECEK